ncbi:hypothetical protein [Pseudocolwellia sp. HL-MZ7]|uniref:hypothetical protein n=1 Tax=Pseudocolwellia sp. HL-MZ7 TaxID=3400627 RepID=UPI003CEF9045
MKILIVSLCSLFLFSCATPLEDPRIQKEKYTDAQSENILDVVNKQDEEKQLCIDKFLGKYSDKVLKHCQFAGYAENIGGGCYHIAGYAVHTAVLEKALLSCKIEI